METGLELDVLIYPDEVRVVTPEDLIEWELETASQVSIPTVRLFVALYPYNPAAMSPNQETAAEELPFVPGQIIKVNTMWCLLLLQLCVKVMQVGWCTVFFCGVLACVTHMYRVYFLTSSVEKLLWKNMMLFPVCATFRAAECVRRYKLFFFISWHHFHLIDVICRLFTESVYYCDMQIHTCIVFFFQNLK